MKSLPNTFIYESILIKIDVNANIINTEIFHLLSMTSTVIESHECHFYVYFTLNLSSYGQVFVLVLILILGKKDEKINPIHYS